jgi:hypothetical protein
LDFALGRNDENLWGATLDVVIRGRAKPEARRTISTTLE